MLNNSGFYQTQVPACSSPSPAVSDVTFLWLRPLKIGMCPEACSNFTQAETCNEEETEPIQSRKEQHQMRHEGGMRNIQQD